MVDMLVNAVGLIHKHAFIREIRRFSVHCLNDFPKTRAFVSGQLDYDIAVPQNHRRSRGNTGLVNMAFSRSLFLTVDIIIGHLILGYGREV